jgi:adenylate cyclase
MDMLAEPRTCQFDDFLLDLRVRGLFQLDTRRVPIPVPLGSRAIDILCLLVGRRGGMVTRQEIMDAVWPNLAVEEQNLTVQISALRRVLDEARAGASCIQTIPGRGYRFLAEIVHPGEPASNPAMTVGVSPPVPPLTSVAGSGDVTVSDPLLPPSQARENAGDSSPLLHDRQTIRIGWLAAACLVAVALLGLLAWYTLHNRARIDHPRLSLVVLPLQNLSGNPAEDYLADGITDDLTTDLSHIPEAFVIARESAYTYKGKATDVRQIGRELGVRYVLEGSVRKLGTTLRVNAQLVSTETGVHLWSDRFDEDVKDLGDGQQRVVARMRGALGIGMVDIERARSLRERPANPDAFDLILQARALLNQPPTPQRQAEALALYERALLLDPSSVLAMAGTALMLLDPWADRGYWANLDSMDRAEQLTKQAVAAAPMSEDVLRARVYMFRVQGRWQEAMAAAERFIEMFPNSQTGYIVLGLCKTYTGNAAEEITLNERLTRLNPRSSSFFNFYRRMGFASLMLGRDQDAITLLERSMALHPDMSDSYRQGNIRLMAAAYERLGEVDRSRRALAEADRIWPFGTVRGQYPEDPTSVAYAEQVRSFQEGLRRAGLRDHADEDADFGVASDAELHRVHSGLTPRTAPGARTIRTGDLVALLAERKPLVIDPMTYFWGRSITGAVGLKHAGAGGSLSGSGQERLRRKVAALTGGDLSKPIVAVGWNSERFDGYNLALRLVAMGYTNVYWYRGGREAWEVAGLPETELTATDW